MASDASTLAAEIRSSFGDDLDDSLVSECVKLCQANNLNGNDLLYKWEATRFNSGPIPPLTMKDIPELKAELVKAQRKDIPATKRVARGFLSGTQSRKINVSGGRGGRTQLSGQLGTTVKPVVRDQDGFDMLRVEDKRTPVPGPSRVSFVGPSQKGTPQRQTYRYMYEKVSERSEVLDDRIDHFGELVKEYYQIEELGDPAAVTEEDVIVVGRVVLDAESSASSVKLNEASLMLESSRMMGSGVRVQLRFDTNVKLRRGKKGISGQGLFPGAIVALKGRNGGGGAFLTTEILSLPPLDAPSPTLMKSESGNTQFTMHVACGPFTTDGDLRYRHLQILMTKLKSAKPAVTLLVGPFVDANHPLIKSGDIDLTPTEIFRTEIVNRIHDFLESSPGSIVLLLPSMRDMTSDYAVFPQPRFDCQLCGDRAIHFLPNPARFTLNGIYFAASSVDVLFHLRKEELFKRAIELDSRAEPADPEGQAPSDAMANLCRHILQQRSFYPIFPVPLDLANEVNLDVTHSDLLHLIPQDDDTEIVDDPSRARCAPDVLIVPSRLKHFSKLVDGTVAINPSYLTKSTYAVLEYAGHTALGPAKDRIKVEINRVGEL